MNTHTGARRYNQLDAERWVGKTVKTTGDVTGIVARAHPNGSGSKIQLHVWVGSTADMLVTDNEHATIVKA